MTEENSQNAFALVEGQPYTHLPDDLYIPPDALEVFLETFEGPLDLLLYLIRKQNLDILNIPIAEITAQYTQYIDLMQQVRLELAAEYLVMAAMLAEIKSRMLLPRPVQEDEDEEDPRAQLVRRLQEYERYKQASEDLDALPRLERDVHLVRYDCPNLDHTRPLPEVSFKELMQALRDVLQRADNHAHHHIQKERLSIRERMSQILSQVKSDEFTEFSQLFTIKEGKMGVVVTFIAVLELVKQSMIELIQNEAFSPIHVRAVSE